MVGVFTPWELTNATNETFFFFSFPESCLLNQNTTACIPEINCAWYYYIYIFLIITGFYF